MCGYTYLPQGVFALSRLQLAQRIMVVDAPGDWFGTTRLNTLDYRHAPIEALYPFQTDDQKN